MTCAFKTWMMTLTAASLLVACGGGEAETAAEDLDPSDINGLIQQQADAAKDVKIRDKKSLNKNARIANDYIQGMDRVALALEDVNDEASAKKAAQVMSEIGKEFDELAEELEGAGANRERALATVMMSRSTELMAVQQRMAANMMRIQSQHPELMPVISEAMAEMN